MSTPSQTLVKLAKKEAGRKKNWRRSAPFNGLRTMALARLKLKWHWPMHWILRLLNYKARKNRR